MSTTASDWFLVCSTTTDCLTPLSVNSKSCEFSPAANCPDFVRTVAGTMTIREMAWICVPDDCDSGYCGVCDWKEQRLSAVRMAHHVFLKSEPPATSAMSSYRAYLKRF